MSVERPIPPNANRDPAQVRPPKRPGMRGDAPDGSASEQPDNYPGGPSVPPAGPPESTAHHAGPGGVPGSALIAFTGQHTPLIHLALKVSLLTILTLGVYRFWGKTALRRYFWNNTEVAGDPLEYTGTGRELFLGFLIVIAVLSVVGAGYEALTALLPANDFGLRGLSFTAYYVLLIALINVGFYRLWRYRLTRTRWRGIRLGLDGSTWTYLWRALAWTTATLLSLGLAYPWMQIDLLRYRLNHTRLGQTRLVFTGTGRDLFGPWLLTLSPLVLIFLGAAALNTELIGSLVTLFLNQDGTTQVTLPSPHSATGWMLLLLIPFIALFVWYKVWTFRYTAAHIDCGGVTFRSGLSAPRVFSRYALYFLALAGLGVLIALPPYLAGLTHVFTSLSGAFFGGHAAYLALAGLMIIIAAPVLKTWLVHYNLAHAICETLDISDPAALEDIMQASTPAPGLGEGLADVFDIDGF